MVLSKHKRLWTSSNVFILEGYSSVCFGEKPLLALSLKASWIFWEKNHIFVSREGEEERVETLGEWGMKKREWWLKIVCEKKIWCNSWTRKMKMEDKKEAGSEEEDGREMSF